MERANSSKAAFANLIIITSCGWLKERVQVQFKSNTSPSLTVVCSLLGQFVSTLSSPVGLQGNLDLEVAVMEVADEGN